MTINQETLDAIRVREVAGAIAVPESYRLVPAELFGGKAKEYRGTVRLDDIESFCSYLADHCTEDGIVLADSRQNMIAARLDWHREEPVHSLHVAEFPLQLTEEYQRWTGISGRQLGQVEFAEFLEENLDQVVHPPAADLLTIATTLEGKRNVNFKSGVKLANGDVQIGWEEQTQAKAAGELKVPAEITLRLPVYQGAEKATTYDFRTLFRYRVREGRLTFEIKVLGTERIRETAFRDVVAGVSETLTARVTDPPPVRFGAVTASPIEILNRTTR